MEQVLIEVISPFLANIGLGSLFLWLYIKERTRNEVMADKVLHAFEKNSEVQAGVKAALDGYNDSVDRLSMSVDTLLRR